MLSLKVAKAKVEISQLMFVPDGTALCVSAETSLSLWDIPGGQKRSQVPTANISGGNVCFHPSGRWLFGASSGEGLAAYDFVTKTACTASRDFAVGTVQTTRGGDAVVCYWFERNAYYINGYECCSWSADGTFGPGWSVESYPNASALAWSYGPVVLADGSRFLTLDYQIGHSPRLATRSLTTGEVLSSSSISIQDYPILAVSPDDSLLAVAVRMSLFAFAVSNPARPLHKVNNDNHKHFTGIAFHPSGKYLAATSNDKTVKLYDTTTWEVARTFTWKIGRMRSIAFSPDGTLAAAGGDKGQVVVWDVDL